jgi:hypothetical protein
MEAWLSSTASKSVAQPPPPTSVGQRDLGIFVGSRHDWTSLFSFFPIKSVLLLKEF